jgi:DNA repair protein RadC
MADKDSIASHSRGAERRSMSARERARAYEVAPAPARNRGKRNGAEYGRRMPARECRTIDAALAILERDLTQREVFSSPVAVKQYLRLQLGDQVREHFGVMCLDAQNRLIAFEIVASGTLTQTSVYPREVVLRALAHAAASVVLAHNHPSGTVHPSRADEALTQTLKAALALVDVRVLDHVIVSAGDALSMAERGLI